MINTYPHFHKAYRYFLIAISLAIISLSPLLQASPVNFRGLLVHKHFC